MLSIVPLIRQAIASLTQLLPLPHLNAPPTDPLKLGRWGEEYVVKLLKRQGMWVVARNWRDRRREIDLVMLDRSAQEIVFVEVKTRTNVTGTVGDIEGDPLRDEQIEHIAAAINIFLQRHSLVLKRQRVRRYRLELVRVVVEEKKLSSQRLTTRKPESSNELRINVSRSVLIQEPIRVVLGD